MNCKVVSIPTGHHTSFRRIMLLKCNELHILDVSIPTGHHTSFRLVVCQDITKSWNLGFNPDWAPHFIPTLFLRRQRRDELYSFNPDWAPHFIPTIVAKTEKEMKSFQSRLGTTLHSDLRPDSKQENEISVSIPTGHHTSFRRQVYNA